MREFDNLNKQVIVSSHDFYGSYNAKMYEEIERREAFHKYYKSFNNQRLKSSRLEEADCSGRVSHNKDCQYLFLSDNHIVDYHWESGSARFAVYSDTSKNIESILDEFVSDLEIVSEEKEEEIFVSFYYRGPNGADSYNRKIQAANWDDIQYNYTEDTRLELAEIIKLKTWNDELGKLILWRGDPGGGKTYALRALCKEWKDWAKFYYVTDPDSLLDGPPDYLMHLCLDGNDKELKLIILEDSGELLATDAMHQKGQGLSRLLNVADGMIGQGLNVAFLITTNQDIKKLHTAVARSGRCAFDTKFELLDPFEANEWLDNRGEFAHVHEPTALADLYATVNNHKKNARKEKIKLGFV